LGKFVVEISCQVEALLLSVINDFSSELHFFARCPSKACREGIKRLADALQLDQSKVREATG
jgi:hypothetical protein